MKKEETPTLADHPLLKRIDDKARVLANDEAMAYNSELKACLLKAGVAQVCTTPAESPTWVQTGDYAFARHGPSGNQKPAPYAWAAVLVDHYRQQRFEFHRKRLSDEAAKQLVLE